MKAAQLPITCRRIHTLFARSFRRLALLWIVILPAFAHALTLPTIFGDHMVLQTGKPVPVWGTAAAGVRVEVSFADRKKSVTADANGNWRLSLDPLPVNATSRSLVVRADGEKPATIRFEDVLVGEVWLCSGQSNMFWPVGQIANSRSSWPGVQNGDVEVANAKWPLIRLNCADDYELGPGGWRACTPESVRGFSATAYFFGRELHRQLGVPIGLINRSIGGTSLQAWTPKPELEAVPFVQENARLLADSQAKIQQWNREFAAFRQATKAKKRSKAKRPEPLPPELETARKLQNHGELHAKHIAPLAPYALRGNIWYQGETNASPRALAAAYDDMLGALIAGRRRLWGDSTLPFYFVQLPLFTKGTDGDDWHVMREAMRRTHTRTPHSGIVVTYDFSDSSLLHPPEKQEVGRRLALWALARDYGRAVEFSGPLLREVRFEGSSAVIQFDHTRGLKTSDGQPARGFEVAGSDGKFHPATAVIEGEKIAASSAQVTAPRHVRFFFGPDELPNLVNAAGLPASPFTTEPLQP